ncbi:HPF/RaiA family ribosome-associated protein [Methyloferula stellata]|uniref:HPF/RaiA family ribosome-associated protein n=1 Tax=Methyloferula stellata TaxID=876270 RepID=UPI000373241D|nr:HPF/RaiA family ribosome-associated protein [Methyloferula stellata]
MQVPAEISFQNYEPSEQIRAEIEKQISKLEKFSSRITSCHLAIIGPHSRHHQGEAFKIDLRLAMPEHKDIIVNKSHGDKAENEHILVAIRNAFGVAQRQIEDAARDMRGQTKVHVPEDHGRVTKFVVGEDCGFIETDDGREIYFHRNAVLDGAFDRLSVGSEVRFSEEKGEKGPQASTVSPIGKHHIG